MARSVFVYQMLGLPIAKQIHGIGKAVGQTVHLAKTQKFRQTVRPDPAHPDSSSSGVNENLIAYYTVCHKSHNYAISSRSGLFHTLPGGDKTKNPSTTPSWHWTALS